MFKILPIVGKANGGQLGESFGQAFLKACAVEAAKASSPSAEGEKLMSAFLFENFFFAPSVCKEKVAKEFQQ